MHLLNDPQMACTMGNVQAASLAYPTIICCGKNSIHSAAIWEEFNCSVGRHGNCSGIVVDSDSFRELRIPMAHVSFEGWESVRLATATLPFGIRQ